MELWNKNTSEEENAMIGNTDIDVRDFEDKLSKKVC
jgi:hypothetical protein